MASIHDKGTASLAPGWEHLPTKTLRELRTVLSARMVLMLKKNNLKESENCRDLVASVRQLLAVRAALGDKEAA